MSARPKYDSVWSITNDDPNFPDKVRARIPGVRTLWGHGTLPLGKIAVIVGARAASADDMAWTSRLARDFVARGFGVVSGGAVGIDRAAHEGALAAGGYTCVVLGGGTNSPYPSQHAGLFARVVAAGGCVLSQFPPHELPRAGTFVSRNATMAALADVVIVVGSSARSGALHTARAAKRFGVVLGAKPGQPGCDALISAGVGAVENPADLDGLLRREIQLPRHIELPDPETASARVLQALRSDVLTDDLAAVTGLSGAAIASALCELQSAGLAVPSGALCYRRTVVAERLLASSEGRV